MYLYMYQYIIYHLYVTMNLLCIYVSMHLYIYLSSFYLLVAVGAHDAG